MYHLASKSGYKLGTYVFKNRYNLLFFKNIVKSGGNEGRKNVEYRPKICIVQDTNCCFYSFLLIFI